MSDLPFHISFYDWQNLLLAFDEGVAVSEGEKFVYVNDALCKMYGYTPKELRSLNSFLDIIVPEERDRLSERIRARLQGDTRSPLYGETVVMHKNGSIVHVAYSMKIFPNEERPRVFSIIKNISEKKLAEQHLRENQTLLSTAEQLAHIGSWEWDIANNTVSWSDELYRIYGLDWKKSPMNYEGLLAYIHPTDKKHAQKIIEESYISQRPFNFYYRIVRPDKIVRTLHARGEVMVDENGKPIKMFGTAQDVTERVQEEEMQKLSVAATQSYNSVIIADSNGKIEWVNEGFTALTGYSLEEVKSTHGEILRKGSETGLSTSASMYAAVMREKKPFTYENKNYSKDGSEYWVITTLTPVLDRNGDVERIIAIESDITLRKRMEEDLVRANKIAEHSLVKRSRALDELMKAKKQLEESMHVKEQFLANMSHEIRTPMNAIVGFTELLLKTELSQDQGQYIEAIKTSGENLLVIINDILDFSKIQSGKIPFEQIPFRLSQVMGLITEMMLPRSMEKKIRLVTVIDKKIPDRLIGDPTRLNQILLNLIGNSIKFTEKGEVKISVSLLSRQEEETALEFSVSDTGIGIHQDKLSKIFEAFTQESSETTRRYGGTGLGLAIVKQLVEMQGGKISVKSTPGVGSVFSFSFKFRIDERPEKETKPALEKAEILQEEKLKGLNVLLVEDNLLNQMLAKKVLTDWSWNVDVAENGSVAVEKVRQKNYDIVLMDIQLPEIDGYEATLQIRNKLPEPKNRVPIMAMTAHAINSEEEKCYSVGMNGYISKPFNQQHLYSKIVSVVKQAAGRNNSQKNNLGHNGSPAKTSAMKHTDLSYLRQLSNGNDKFVSDMLAIFLQQTPESVTSLEKHLQARDWKALRAAAHKMKPSISFVGIKELEADIRALEDAAASETDLEKIPALVSRIRSVCSEAIAELKEEVVRMGK